MDADPRRCAGSRRRRGQGCPTGDRSPEREGVDRLRTRRPQEPLAAHRVGDRPAGPGRRTDLWSRHPGPGVDRRVARPARKCPRGTAFGALRSSRSDSDGQGSARWATASGSRHGSSANARSVPSWPTCASTVPCCSGRPSPMSEIRSTSPVAPGPRTSWHGNTTTSWRDPHNPSPRGPPRQPDNSSSSSTRGGGSPWSTRTFLAN